MIPSAPPPKNGKFKLESSVKDGEAVFKLHGMVDEDAHFASVLATVKANLESLKRVRFDLGGVSHVNSSGIREWLLLLERLYLAPPIEIVNVSSGFVEQANMVSNVFSRPGLTVISFAVPFYCEKCESSKTVVVESKALKQGKQVVIPDAKCPKCFAAMELDSVEEDYLSVIRKLAGG